MKGDRKIRMSLRMEKARSSLSLRGCHWYSFLHAGKEEIEIVIHELRDPLGNNPSACW